MKTKMLDPDALPADLTLPQQLVTFTERDLELEQTIGVGHKCQNLKERPGVAAEKNVSDVNMNCQLNNDLPKPAIPGPSSAVANKSKDESVLSVDENKKNLTLRQKANETAILNLISGTQANCKAVEALALDFVAEQIHHPVFSCFRDLMNPNDFSIIISPKRKLVLKNFEYVMVCLGMIDSIAMTLHNPLHQDTFNCPWNRKISTRVEKLLYEIKPFIVSWGSSEKPFLQERCNLVITFLRRLVPHFKTVWYDKQFELSVSSIEHDVTTKLLARQEKAAFLKAKPGATEDSSSSMSSTASLFDLAPPPEADRFASMTETKLNFAKLSTNTLSDLLDSSSENKKKKVPCSPRKTSIVLTSTNTNNNVETEQIEFISDVNVKVLDEPVSKKAKMDASNPGPASKGPEPTQKPKVNAFTVLMNRSREISKTVKTTSKSKKL